MIFFMIQAASGEVKEDDAGYFRPLSNITMARLSAVVSDRATTQCGD